MDYALLPPKVNSARMYAGPGSGPMMAAASAWDALAADLQSTASSYQSAITALIAGPWLGPSAATMAAAAAPYVDWMRATAAQAEQTANQATAPVVAANRSLLAALVATNFFGQNTPSIAATETQYSEMWAQDASAMYSYAGASASATTLTPFSFAAVDHQLEPTGEPGGRGRPSQRHPRRQHSERDVSGAAGVFCGTQRVE